MRSFSNSRAKSVRSGRQRGKFHQRKKCCWRFWRSGWDGLVRAPTRYIHVYRATVASAIGESCGHCGRNYRTAKGNKFPISVRIVRGGGLNRSLTPVEVTSLDDSHCHIGKWMRKHQCSTERLTTQQDGFPTLSNVVTVNCWPEHWKSIPKKRVT